MRKNLYPSDSDRYKHLEVTENAPLLEWLIRNSRESRNKIKSILRNRGIKVNKRVVTQFDYQLNVGDKVSISKSKQNDQFRSRYIRLVYEDSFLVVIEKQSGVLSMAAGHSSLNVKSVLDDYFRRTRQRCTAHVVHRLDRDTSGLMIYAKDIQTEQILEHDWHNIVYDRRYIAVLSGEMETSDGTIANWLKDTKSYFTFSSPVDNGGKYAVTHYRVLNRTVDQSLVEFCLETGRKNQIRVHAADMGHPVCGDMKYGNGHDPIGRLCLHAYVLCFNHPINHSRMEFETPIPAQFRRLFK